MTQISWDDISARHYEFGVDRGVFYPKNAPGVPWNGLISITERVTGDNDSYIYIDGRRVRQGKPQRIFDFNLKAFAPPDGVALNPYEEFGLCYRTKTEAGYKLHLVYNVLGSLQSSSYETMNNGVNVMSFEWAMAARPEVIPGVTPTPHLVMDSSIGYSGVMAALEEVLYGTDTSAPALPTPQEILAIVDAYAGLKITDNGDGTWTADGPAEAITVNSDGTFQISWPSAVIISPGLFRLSNF